ncbi:hypothetical protein J6590_014271 [Homalodisca vitripennis]|nr:hypothetical protein J6590_014271 [Homalodisca vitripennis]
MPGTSSTYLLTPGILMRQDNCFDSTTGGTTPAKLSWRLSKHAGHIIYLYTYTRQLLRQYNRRYYTSQTELMTRYLEMYSLVLMLSPTQRDLGSQGGFSLKCWNRQLATFTVVNTHTVNQSPESSKPLPALHRDYLERMLRSRRPRFPSIRISVEPETGRANVGRKTKKEVQRTESGSLSSNHRRERYCGPRPEASDVDIGHHFSRCAVITRASAAPLPATHSNDLEMHQDTDQCELPLFSHLATSDTTIVCLHTAYCRRT